MPSIGACTFRTIISHQRPLSVVYGIVSRAGCTHLTVDIRPVQKKKPGAKGKWVPYIIYIYRESTKEWCGFNVYYMNTAPFFCVCPVYP
jgi:hypothetical protein